MRGIHSTLVVLLIACACSAEAQDPPEAAAPDAGAIVEPTTCCDLRNERGERLNYMCGEAVNVEWAEARGYRCWLVP